MNNLDDILIKALAAKKSKEFLLARPAYHLNLWQRCRRRYFWRKHARGWPMAYLAGHKEFYGLDFLVNKHTLIPRPDTELLVEEALSVIARSETTKQNLNKQNQTILIDIGTGTGCIPISIATVIARPKAEAITLQARDCFVAGAPRDDIKIYAADISGRALRIAKKNAQRHGVNIKFVQGSLLQPFIKKSLLSTDADLIITANLPYLTRKQFQSEPTIQKEPPLALIADDKNGLSLYEELLKQIKNLNHSATIFLEIDPRQSVEMNKLIQNIFPKAKFEIKKDLAKRDRLAIIRINW